MAANKMLIAGLSSSSGAPRGRRKRSGSVKYVILPWQISISINFRNKPEATRLSFNFIHRFIKQIHCRSRLRLFSRRGFNFPPVSFPHFHPSPAVTAARDEARRGGANVTLLAARRRECVWRSRCRKRHFSAGKRRRCHWIPPPVPVFISITPRITQSSGFGFGFSSRPATRLIDCTAALARPSSGHVFVFLVVVLT